tara:strand:+ start:1200 stop:2027 length:828 start_codon:yes stop_codon:yes gene_type:complete
MNIKEPRIMAVEQYKMLNRSRALLKAQQESWSDFLSKPAIGHISENGRFSFRSTPEVFAEIEAFQKLSETNTHSRNLWMATGGLEEIGDAIRKMRSNMRSVAEYAPLAKHKQETRMYGSHALDRSFPTSQTNLSIRGSGSFDIENPHATYGRKLHVYVPASWHYSVGSRGLGMIKAGSGYRFIMNGFEADVPWVAEEGLKAYRVHALRVHSGNASAEDGWVVVTADTNATWENALVDTSERTIRIPHGYNTSLRKAVALVRNRTFSKLENMLDAI